MVGEGEGKLMGMESGAAGATGPDPLAWGKQHSPKLLGSEGL